METAVTVWMILLPFLVFFMAMLTYSALFARDKRVRQAILKAGDIILSDKDLQRKKDGLLITWLTGLLSRSDRLMNLEKLLGYDLKNMLLMMGEKKQAERILADHLATALLAGLVLLVIPVITGAGVYVLCYPLGVMIILLGQARSVKKRYKNWQTEVIKDIPELIDKMRISLASGKDYISALKRVQENSGPRLGTLLDKLITDMQIMRPAQALDEFSRAFGMPVMVKFATAVKIGIESGYEQAENYFINIEQDIRELRRVALDELTRSKPEKVFILSIIMVGHAIAALVLTAVSLFQNINQIF